MVVVAAELTARRCLGRSLGTASLQILRNRQMRGASELLWHLIVQDGPNRRVAEGVEKPHSVRLSHGATGEPIPPHQRTEDGAEIGAHRWGYCAIKHIRREDQTDHRGDTQDDLFVQ